MAQRNDASLQAKVRRAMEAQRRNYSLPFTCEHTTTDVGVILTPLAWQELDVCTNPACREVVGEPRLLAMPRRQGLYIIGSTQRSGAGCAVQGCTNDGPYEVHHWWPRYAFGDESERGPTDVLCLPHHRYWHRVMREQVRRFA